MNLPREDVVKIQTALVDIWQIHIRAWVQGQGTDTIVPIEAKHYVPEPPQEYKDEITPQAPPNIAQIGQSANGFWTPLESQRRRSHFLQKMWEIYNAPDAYKIKDNRQGMRIQGPP